MELILYALLIFFAVAAVVYAVLARSGSTAGDVESGARFASQWDAFEPKKERWKWEGISLLSAFRALQERLQRFIENMGRSRVSDETETLFFVLQFLMYMESGMTTLAALQKTQEMMEEVGYRMAGELRMINFKLRAGATFTDAIEVIKNNELREFFLVISQSQQIGVPISDALKNAIVEYEETRVARAEARAARVSVFLAVPIVFGFLPAIFILILMPAVHGLFGAFQ
jgi:pilus assembly protein TadC